jgi:hypothetical protein
MRPALVVITCIVLALAAAACSSSSDSDGGILSGGNNSKSGPPASSDGSKPSSGASSSDKAPAATAKPTGNTSNVALDPCKLLPKEDAQAALGKPVSDGKLTESNNPLGQKLCFYAASAATDPASIQLSVITTGGLSDQMKNNKWSAKQQFTSSKNLGPFTAFPGMGEDAFVRGPTLSVLKGDTTIDIMIVGLNSGSPEHTNALRVAATRIVPKLP